MGQEAYPVRASIPEVVEFSVRGLGGATAVTHEEGDGVTISYVSTGIYRLTWAEAPGTFVSAKTTLQAATPGDLAGHTAICDTYASLIMDVHVFNASDALHDLAANEYLLVEVKFKRVSV